MIIENRKIININDSIPKLLINGIFSIVTICCVFSVLTLRGVNFDGIK